MLTPSIKTSMRIGNYLFIIALISIVSCTKKNLSNSPKANLGWQETHFSKYISEYSPHTIGNKESVMIRLSSTPTQQIDITQEASDYLSISPKVDGDVKWQDANTIVFTPKTKFQNAAIYEFKLKVDELYTNTTNEESLLTLMVSVKPQQLKLELGEVNYTSAATNLTLDGNITSVDEIEEGQHKSLITAEQDGKPLVVNWNNIASRDHSFSIGGIERKNAESNIIVKYNGKSIDSKFVGERKINIVPKGIFTFLSGRKVSGTNKIIELSFSDPISKSQDINGLITINNQASTLNYEIDDNIIRLFLDEVDAENVEVNISNNIVNASNKKLSKAFSKNIVIGNADPQLMTLRQGVILPETDNVLLPIQTQNIKSIQIIVTKIFQNNVLQFLQNNNMSETYELNPVGKEVINRKIILDSVGSSPKSDTWTKYTLDLNKIVNLEQGAIYNVKVQFNRDDVIALNCRIQTNPVNDNSDEESTDYNSPCHPNYYYEYNNHFINMNILSSSIGIIGKVQKNNKAYAIVTDINTGEPITDADVTFYSFQKQILCNSKSDKQGVSICSPQELPTFVIVKQNGIYGYLNLEEFYKKNTTEFDVEGKELESGLDAFIYGERGVYRPGDTMHISVMMHNHMSDVNAQSPAGFPVNLKVYDSRGKLQYDRISNGVKNNVYYYAVPTSENANTGNWKLIAELGNEKFIKYIKVESIKPNRLKIKYANLDKDINLYNNPTLNLSAVWLHGALADGLKANATSYLEPYDITFKKYKEYIFSDPARMFEGVSSEVYDGNMDANGNAFFNLKTGENLLPPSALKMTLKTKVFEKSGNFSEDFGNYVSHPYKNYVGLKLPVNKWGGAYYESDKDINFAAVLVSSNGTPLANKKLNVGFYEAKWDWWYSESNYEILKYNTGNHIGAIKSTSVTTNAKGEAIVKDNFQHGMNYLIRICDPESGHCTGNYFYTSKWGTPPSDNNSAQIIKLQNDKEEYKVGEVAKISVPSYLGSKIILSIEKGNEVTEIKRLEGKDNTTTLEIPVTKEMFPNAYIHVSLIQPYAQNKSNLPLRLYGIVNLNVIDQSKKLNPRINAPKVSEPNKTLSVEVSETNGLPMTYTLAMVDEGLLSLTRHKTPDPMAHFFSKQSLGVSTWDMYDLVMSKYGDEYENIFSVGGDGEIVNTNSIKKADRFLPVVKYVGVFSLEKGEKKNHKVNIPNYGGEVRLMVVAKSEDRYGNAESSVQIKQDLMVQNTLPRVLSPGDEVNFSANVFSMNDKIKSVNVGLSHNNLFSSVNKSSILNFDTQGDKLSNFPLLVGAFEGIGTVKASVKSGTFSSYEENSISIRNPNEARYEVNNFVIKPGSKMNIPVNFFGIPGSNHAEIEASNAPNINLTKRLNYLINYPYGCAEQITSSAYAQLYLDDFMNLSSSKMQQRKTNISATINKLSQYQLTNGSFTYWPADNNYDDWVTSYIGTFLIDAKAKGFYVNENMLKKWASFQKERVINFQKWNNAIPQNQAFRLYALARYGKPEIAAMNKLKSNENLDPTSLQSLAAAYSLVGKKEVADELFKKATSTKLATNTAIESYDSDLRNNALYAEALVQSGRSKEALPIIKQIEKELNSTSYYNTLGISYALKVLQKFYTTGMKSDLKMDYFWNGNKETIASGRGYVNELIVKNTNKQNITVTNNGTSNLYFSLITSGKDPITIDREPTSNNINMIVKYNDVSGNPIDISNLKQGTSFIATIDISGKTASKTNLDNMALNFIVPAGWEINNDRLANIDINNNGIQFQQILDDRVHSFFTLNNRRIVVKIPLTATYAGSFYFPSIRCESMYKKDFSASTAPSKVNILEASSSSKPPASM